MEKLDGEIWLSRYASAKQNADMMKNLWDDCRRYTMPHDSSPDYAETHSEGKRKANPVDSTAVDLLEKMVSGLHSSTISYGDRWFILDSDSDAQSKYWASENTRAVITEMQKSNFISTAHSWIRHACGYGTGILYIGEMNGLPQYRDISVTDDVCLETDMFGNVCVVYVAYRFTALQAIQMFGVNNPNLSDSIKREFSEARSISPKKHTFIHVCYPKELFGEKVEIANDDDEMPYEEKYRPYGGLFIEKDTGSIVSQDGFFEFPFAVIRPIRSSDEVYGRSIPMLAMDSIKTLNEAQAMVLDASKMAIRPPIGVPAGFPKLNLVPGAVMKCPITSQNQIWTYSTQANIPIGDNMIVRLADVLRSMFKEDFFMAVSKKSEMSATEVAERVRQATDFISPMVMNIHTDGFRPIVMRTLGILERNGVIPRRPKGANVKISFLSRIDSMIRQADASRNLQFLQQSSVVGQCIAANPDMENVVNKDFVYNEFRDALGVHAGIMYDEYTRTKNRQAAASAAAQARQEELQIQAMGKTDMTKPVDPTSILGRQGG